MQATLCVTSDKSGDLVFYAYVNFMKKVKEKYIRLTESELHRIISEEVKRVIPLILEYAVPRNKFVDGAYDLLEQICQNWCLIRYSRLVNDGNVNVNHWKSELKAHMKNIAQTKIKKNNSVTSRASALAEAFDWSDFDKSEKKIFLFASDKFEEEGYPSDYEEPFVTVCFDFKHEVKNLILLMANSNNDDIDEYVNSL